MEIKKIQTTKIHFDWIDALKAFALIAILWNHFVETFTIGSWFTNPSENWPDFGTRMHGLFYTGQSFGLSLIQYLGWLGDSGPGIFILISGLALTLSILAKGIENFNPIEFYKKRLLRIIPLFIVIHLIILCFAIFIPGNNVNISNTNILLSLIGLRFTDSLFYFINPSWWFIWLIIQFYIIFPLLIRLLVKFGIRNFLIFTLGFTFLARGLGLVGLHYNQNLSNWMTGIFFGTRLAEFSSGMAIAVYLSKSNWQIIDRFSPPKILLFSFLIYFTGLLCSFTWIGSIVSNLLVTLGLSGLFYFIWLVIKKMKLQRLNNAIIWIGVSSYAIFLFHQPFLTWTADYFHGPLRLLATIFALIICFPAAYLIDKYTQFLVDQYKTYQMGRFNVWILNLYSSALLFIWFFIEPKISFGLKYNLFSIFIIISVIFVMLLAAKTKPKRMALFYPYWWGIALVSIFQLFVLPEHYGFLTIFFLSLLYLIGFVSFTLIRNFYFEVIVSLLGFIISLTIIFGIIDPFLRDRCPLETTDRWGEYPALQLDSGQVYSLIPNKVTHLKYNNYDYMVRTNSFGLNCPEFTVRKPDSIDLRILVIGDAFTMPEGMKYKYSYPALLEKSLNRQLKDKKVQVINAGVTGYGPVEELGQMKVLIPLLKPDIVLYEFFINEFDEVSLTPEMRRTSVGLISNVGPVKRYFRNSQVISYLAKFKDYLMEKVWNNPKNWRYWKALLYFYENRDNPYYTKTNLMLVSQYLNSMNQVTQIQRSKFVICFVPGAISVSKKSDIHYFPKGLDLNKNSEFDLLKPYQYLRNITDSLKLNLLDLTDTLKSDSIQPVYFPDSWHWNKEGHKVVARAITNYLFKKGMVQK